MAVGTTFDRLSWPVIVQEAPQQTRQEASVPHKLDSAMNVLTSLLGDLESELRVPGQGTPLTMPQIPLQEESRAMKADKLDSALTMLTQQLADLELELRNQSQQGRANQDAGSGPYGCRVAVTRASSGKQLKAVAPVTAEGHQLCGSRGAVPIVPIQQTINIASAGSPKPHNLRERSASPSPMPQSGRGHPASKVKTPLTPHGTQPVLQSPQQTSVQRQGSAAQRVASQGAAVQIRTSAHSPTPFQMQGSKLGQGPYAAGGRSGAQSTPHSRPGRSPGPPQRPVVPAGTESDPNAQIAAGANAMAAAAMAGANPGTAFGMVPLMQPPMSGSRQAGPSMSLPSPPGTAPLSGAARSPSHQRVRHELSPAPVHKQKSSSARGGNHSPGLPMASSHLSSGHGAPGVFARSSSSMTSHNASFNYAAMQVGVVPGIAGPAMGYRVDHSDPIDTMFAQALSVLDPRTSSKLNLRRLAMGRYEIDGRRVTVRWSQQPANGLVAIEDGVRDSEMDLKAYLSQAGNVAASLSGLQMDMPKISRIPKERRLTFRDDDKSSAPSKNLAAEIDKVGNERCESMRLAVEQARLREEAAEAYERHARQSGVPQIAPHGHAQGSSFGRLLPPPPSGPFGWW
eukprot:TRINITY_DN27300_c0_g1_i2.p1 TRINITY_DN27300_c0_g1~~TRINITY_DN27300_c0_g1_i2.p1  ORF type:complete len:626 (+),score=131.36 TRINITY_DN27300_c0_g1_i2:99-1976(+)